MQYIDREQLKQQLNIESTFTTDDAYLDMLCVVASQAVRNYCNGGINSYTGTTTYYSDGTSSGCTSHGSTNNNEAIILWVITNTEEEIQHAALLLAANLYLNRSPVAFSSVVEIPYTLQFLMNPYKNYVVQ